MTQDTLHRHEAGGFTVTGLADGFLELPTGVLTGIEPAQATGLLGSDAQTIRATLNGFLVQGGGRTVLVDTGAGAMLPSTGRLLENLAAAGVDRDQVDTILLTHLHPDHIGGLVKDGTAVFPKATLVVPAAEAAHWLDAAKTAAAPDGAKPYFQGAQAAVAPYGDRTRLLQPGEQPVPGIEAVPLPGHTPGHTGYRIGGTLLIWGDIMHVPQVQGPQPDTGVAFDADPAGAIKTRKDLLATLPDGTVVAGMHLHAPGFARITKQGDGYVVAPVSA